jgi:hypothetical protein
MKALRNIDRARRFRVEVAFQHLQTEYFPKGELWIGADILKKAGFEDNLEGRLKLINQLKQNMICLSTALEPYMNKALGYRYFPVSAIQEVLDTTDLFVMAVIDGPFQRLVGKRGLMKVLTGWVSEKESVLKAYENERADVENLLDCCLERPVHGVAIADDLAGDQGTFFDPLDIKRFSSPFYDRAVSRIHEAHAFALFHSCGKISKIMPQLLSHGFDGLAAVQDRTNDLVSLKARYGSQLVLMAGIEGETLDKEELSPSDLENLGERLHSLSQGGGFILSSSCGLYSGRFLERILAIYRLFES